MTPHSGFDRSNWLQPCARRPRWRRVRGAVGQAFRFVWWSITSAVGLLVMAGFVVAAVIALGWDWIRGGRE